MPFASSCAKRASRNTLDGVYLLYICPHTRFAFPLAFPALVGFFADFVGFYIGFLAIFLDGFFTIVFFCESVFFLGKVLFLAILRDALYVTMI